MNPLSNDGYVLELDDGSGGEFRVCFNAIFLFNEFSNSIIFSYFSSASIQFR